MGRYQYHYTLHNFPAQFQGYVRLLGYDLEAVLTGYLTNLGEPARHHWEVYAWRMADPRSRIRMLQVEGIEVFKPRRHVAELLSAIKRHAGVA